MPALPAKFNSLGLGYDTFKDELKDNTLIEFDLRETEPKVECTIYRCESSQDLTERLEISGSLSVEATAASFDAKASFVSELTKHADAVTFLVKAKHSWTAHTANTKLKDDLKLNFSDVRKLVGFGGDSYVSYVESGIEYYAAYQFAAYNSEEKKKLTGEGKFQAGTGTKVSGSVSGEMERIKKASGTDYTFHQTLCGASLELPDKDGIDAFALALPTKEDLHPMLLKFSTTAYSDLLNAPHEYDKISEWRNAYIKPKSGWFPYSIKAIERNAKVTRDVCDSALRLYDYYAAGPDALKSLRDNGGGCGNAVNIIKDWKLLYEAGTGNLEKPKMDINCLKIPFPSMQFVYGEAAGRTSGGNTFCDFDEQFIYSYGYPKTWRAKGGAVIESITCVYGFRNPSEPYNAQKETTVEFFHGGKDRGQDISFGKTFQPNEIDTIGLWKSGNRDWIDLMCGFEVYPRGGKSAMLGRMEQGFKLLRVPEGHAFIGVQGRSADSVDSLQPVMVRMLPPSWKDVKIEK